MKDALGHGSNAHGAGVVAAVPSKGRGGLKRPLPGHPYHAKSAAELRYIIKDASEAASAAQSMGKLETKYNDQVNDAATVLGYRDRGGTSDHANDVAAAALASGPKSVTTPIHDGMAANDAINRAIKNSPTGSISGREAHTIGRYGYNPDSVNKAIANNRTGKIGGREAKMIHALLKGR